MKDSRLEQLAHSLIHYSVELREGENILIEVTGEALPLAQALVRQAYEAGGVPFVQLNDQTLVRELLKGATAGQMEAWARWDRARMTEMQAYIGIQSLANANELADLPAEKLQVYRSGYMKPVHLDQRVAHTKWCVLRYPNASMAQLAGASSEGFEDFYFDVCNLDYSRMSKAMDPLKELLDKTDRVRLTGPGTDLEFSIKGLPAIKCVGKRNIPDGEIFTSPVRDSVNGRIAYNAPAVYDGFTYDSIAFEFRDGRIVKATANDPRRLERVLDTDEGARYIGEFALGVNPHILTPMKSALFDEKIAGSFHLTPGASYDECFNGNRSAVHWDLVCIQRPEYGGGAIYFDGVAVREDGRFVLPELAALNPENLT